MDIVKRRRLYYTLLVGGGLSPASILGSSLVAWFDANDAATTFQDSGATTPATANNDPVGAWQDKSGNGYHATQGTTANKPTLKTATLNGQTVVNFDGSDILVTGNMPISTFIVWVVWRASTSAVLYEQSVSSFSLPGLLMTSAPFLRKRKDGTVESSKQTTGYSNNAWRITRHGYNGTHATHTLHTNASSVSLTDGTVNDPGSGTVTDALHIGARSGVVSPITGDIAEIVIASPYATAQQIADIEAYINNKWAVY